MRHNGTKCGHLPSHLLAKQTTRSGLLTLRRTRCKLRLCSTGLRCRQRVSEGGQLDTQLASFVLCACELAFKCVYGHAGPA